MMREMEAEIDQLTRAFGLPSVLPSGYTSGLSATSQPRPRALACDVQVSLWGCWGLWVL